MPDPLMTVLDQNYSDTPPTQQRTVPSLQDLFGGGDTTSSSAPAPAGGDLGFNPELAVQYLTQGTPAPTAPEPLKAPEGLQPTDKVLNKYNAQLLDINAPPTFESNPLGYIAKSTYDVIDFTIASMAKMSVAGAEAVWNLGKGALPFVESKSLEDTVKILEKHLSSIDPKVNPIFGGETTGLAQGAIKVGDALPVAAAWIGEKASDGATELGLSPEQAAAVGTIVNVGGLIATGWAAKKVSSRVRAKVKSSYRKVTSAIKQNNQAALLKHLEEFDTTAKNPGLQSLIDDAAQRTSTVADRMKQMREQFPEAAPGGGLNPELDNFFDSHTRLTSIEDRALARHRQRVTNQRAGFENPTLDQLDANRLGIPLEDYQNIRASGGEQTIRGSVEPHIRADRIARDEARGRTQTPSEIMTEVLQENETAVQKPATGDLVEPAQTSTTGAPIQQGTAVPLDVEQVPPTPTETFVPQEIGQKGVVGGKEWARKSNAERALKSLGLDPETHEVVPKYPDRAGVKDPHVIRTKQPPPPIEEEFTNVQTTTETPKEVVLSDNTQATRAAAEGGAEVNPQTPEPQPVQRAREAATKPEKVPLDPTQVEGDLSPETLREQYQNLLTELLDEEMSIEDLQTFTYEQFLKSRRTLGEHARRAVDREASKPQAETSPADILEVSKNEGAKRPTLKGEGAKKAIIFDPQQVGPTLSRDEIIFRGQEKFQELSRELSREDIQLHPDIIELEKQAEKLTRNKEIYGVENPTVDEIRLHQMRTALNEGRRFGEIVSDSKGIRIREYTKSQMEAKLELNKGNELAVTKLTGKQKIEEVNLKETTPIGVTPEEVIDGIRNGDPSFLKKVHPDKQKAVELLYERSRDGLDDSAPRTGQSSFADVWDFFADILTGEEGQRGAIGGRFSETQLARLRRLQGDAVKVGRDIVELMRRTGEFTEAQLALFRQHVDEYKTPIKNFEHAGPKNTPKNTTRYAQGDFIVDQRLEQRIEGERIYQPRYQADIEMLQNSTELKRSRVPLTNQLVTSPRQLEAAGLHKLQVDYRATAQNMNDAIKVHMRFIDEAFTGLSRKELKNISANGLARTKEGRVINKYNGVVPEPLNPREIRALDFIDEEFARFIDDINEVRYNIGLGKIEPIDNYFTHSRTLNLLERMSEPQNLVADKAADLNSKYISHKAASFVHEKERVGGAYNVEYNAKRILQQYERRALTHMHMSPFNARLHELISRALPDPRTGEYTWMLSKERPQLYQHLKDWNNFLSGKSNATQLLGPVASRVISRMNSNLVYSLLSYNYRSAAIQLTASVNGAIELGPRWMASGIRSLMEDAVGVKTSRVVPELSNSELALRSSKILRYRNADVMLDQMGSGLRDFAKEVKANTETIGDALYQFKDPQISDVRKNVRNLFRRRNEKGKARSFKDRALPLARTGGAAVDLGFATQKLVGDAGLAALKYLDFETAKATWIGAVKRYMHNIPEGILQDAYNYADDVVTRTQGSALMGDIAPIQRTAAGRFFTLFQTYAINDFNFLTRDVLGIKGTIDPVSLPAGSWKKIGGYVAATIIANYLLENVNPIPVNSPRPRPAKDFIEGLEEGGPLWALMRVGAGALDVVPGLGQVSKFGKVPSPPAAQAIVEIINALQGRPFNQGLLRTTGTAVGIPGTSQVFRQGAAIKRGQGPIESLGGFYAGPRGSSTTSSRRGSRGRSSRGGR